MAFLGEQCRIIKKEGFIGNEERDPPPNSFPCMVVSAHCVISIPRFAAFDS